MLERFGDPLVAAAAVSAATVATATSFVAQQASQGFDQSTGVLAVVLAAGTGIIGALWKKIRDDAAATTAAIEKAVAAAAAEREKHDVELAEQRRLADEINQAEVQRLREKVEELYERLLTKGDPR